MTMKTDIIQFDLRQRGRRHTGKKRAYETVEGARRVARIVNSAAVQERVKAGDMKGFLGHLPRIQAETPYPPECALKEGKVYYFEPAFRTVTLRATPEGVIEHQAEFMDTPPGRIAARQWANRDGGFSAIIDDTAPDGFYGFDYVAEPNYVFNRGWAVHLDSARTGGASLDSVMREYNDAMRLTDRMMATLQAEYDELLRAHATLSKRLDSAALERDELLDRLARADLETQRRGAFQRPLVVDKSQTERLLRDITAFDNARLPRVTQQGKPTQPTAEDRAYNALLKMPR